MEVNKINKSLIEKEIQFDINTKNMIIKKFQIKYQKMYFLLKKCIFVKIIN